MSIDVPGEAHLPADYVEKEDLRLEAYRRLAASSTPAEVDDVELEVPKNFGLLMEQDLSQTISLALPQSPTLPTAPSRSQLETLQATILPKLEAPSEGEVRRLAAG